MAVAEQAPNLVCSLIFLRSRIFATSGGYVIAGGGRVRRKQLYGSVELNHLQGQDLKRFDVARGSGRCSSAMILLANALRSNLSARHWPARRPRGL